MSRADDWSTTVQFDMGDIAANRVHTHVSDAGNTRLIDRSFSSSFGPSNSSDRESFRVPGLDQSDMLLAKGNGLIRTFDVSFSDVTDRDMQNESVGESMVYTNTPVPLPSSVALGGLGVFALSSRRQRCPRT